MFLISGNYGVLWCTTCQLYCKNNPNDHGYLKYTNYALPNNCSDLKLVALDSHQKFTSFDVIEVYFRQNHENDIFTTIFATFYFKIALKWSNHKF